MSNAILVLVLVGIVAVAVRGCIKHFRGEGGCCGGSSVKPKKKKLSQAVIKKMTFHVEGMHCANCANTVTRVINAMDGAAARVNLNTKMVEVSCDREIEPETIKAVIRKAGYTVLD